MSQRIIQSDDVIRNRIKARFPDHIRTVSITLLARQLRTDFYRVKRIIDSMEAAGDLIPGQQDTRYKSLDAVIEEIKQRFPDNPPTVRTVASVCSVGSSRASVALEAVRGSGFWQTPANTAPVTLEYSSLDNLELVDRLAYLQKQYILAEAAGERVRANTARIELALVKSVVLQRMQAASV